MEGTVKKRDPFSDLSSNGIVNKYHKSSDTTTTDQNASTPKEGIINAVHNFNNNSGSYNQGALKKKF